MIFLKKFPAGPACRYLRGHAAQSYHLKSRVCTAYGAILRLALCPRLPSVLELVGAGAGAAPGSTRRESDGPGLIPRLRNMFGSTSAPDYAKLGESHELDSCRQLTRARLQTFLSASTKIRERSMWLEVVLICTRPTFSFAAVQRFVVSIDILEVLRILVG